jgi:parallel beta-helix repeat protein
MTLPGRVFVQIREIRGQTSREKDNMLKQSFVRVILVVAMLATIAPWADRVGAEGEVVNATYVVDRSDDTIVTACTAAANDCTLRGAVQNANASASIDTITFAAGVNVTLTSGWLDIVYAATTIQGNGRGDTIIYAPNNGDGVFRIQAGSVTIRDLSIIGDGASGGVNQDGVLIAASGSDVIATAIYNMGGSGVRVAQTATGNTIDGNYLGAPATADGHISPSCLFPNQRYGLDVNDDNNLIKGNTIVCNQLGGVRIANNAQNNTVYGNKIGVTWNSVRLGNATAGLILEGGANNNLVGTIAPINRNTISGNSGYGVIVRGSSTVSNTFSGNYIGLSPTGTLAISNTLGGVSIEQQAALNKVQSSWISGNGGPGVRLTNAFSNTLTGNTIGADETSAARGNALDGVLIDGGAQFNQIKSNNLIRYNQRHGVLISDTLTVNNVITANVVNYNSQSGIALLGARYNTLWGLSIYGNSRHGLYLDNGAQYNTLANLTAVNNGGYGLYITGTNTTHNSLVDAAVYNNSRDGIGRGYSATYNWWSNVRAFKNDGMNIDTDIDNDSANVVTAQYPVITSSVRNGNAVTISGKAEPHVSGETVSVEVYEVKIDVTTGFVGGYSYIGSTAAAYNGAWSLVVNTTVNCFTTLSTLTMTNGDKRSSEYGPTSCRVNLPLVLR